jgi:hypothetical protein
VDTVEIFLGDDIEDGEWLHYAEDLENVPDYMWTHEVNIRYGESLEGAEDYEMSYQ